MQAGSAACVPSWGAALNWLCRRVTRHDISQQSALSACARQHFQAEVPQCVAILAHALPAAQCMLFDRRLLQRVLPGLGRSLAVLVLPVPVIHPTAHR